MKILFIGDIVGRPGRRFLRERLAEMRAAHGVDAVIANAENAAGGVGATPEVLNELLSMGIEVLTLGNHTWRHKDLAPALDGFDRVIRPANYPDGVPGRGGVAIRLDDGGMLGVLNLQGRVFMQSFACPFAAAWRGVEALRALARVVVVDFHGEATSEKMAMGWYLDGRCAAVVGTHTHVQTADERVLPQGTAYITDVGMTGPADSVIGVNPERAVHKFLTGMPSEYRLAKGPVRLCGVVIDADEETGLARSIERLSLADG